MNYNDENIVLKLAEACGHTLPDCKLIIEELYKRGYQITQLPLAEYSQVIKSQDPTDSEGWKVGDRVRYALTIEFGPNRGETGVITQLSENCKGKPRSEYQVFWVVPDTGGGIFWTTPEDVELIS